LISSRFLNLISTPFPKTFTGVATIMFASAEHQMRQY
jgi:hypothetical protein